jgi:hypothetical protein
MAENSGNSLSLLPKDKADLLGRIQNEWEALDRLVSRLSEDQLNVRDSGGWSTKDNLAHLASWEQFMILCYLQKRPAYQSIQIDEKTFKKLDENGINEILFRRNKDQSAAEVLKLFRDSHQQVLAYLEKIPFEELMKALDKDDPEAKPVILWVIGDTYDHYSEHQANIRKLIQQK